jgi:RNA polymerase sigma-70 factor (ECF subfamily)
MMNAEAGVIDERAIPADPVVPIIRAARAGDAAAFEELMQLTERRVAQIAWSVLGNTDDVKDAVQETFLRLYRHLKRYDESKSFSGWVSRITVNVCRDQLRRRRSARIFEPLADDAQNATSDIAADDELIRRDEVALLGRAIDQLPPKERLVVILRDLEGMRTDEVAEALGTSAVTVRVQISRARIKLRKFIESWRGGRAS